MIKIGNGKGVLFPVPVDILKWLGCLLGRQEQVTRLTENLTIDITYTRETLEWVPPISFEQGIAEMYKKGCLL